MREYLRSIIVLWRAPAEVKKRAVEEMKSELEALPPNWRDKANRSRGKKEWKIVLAAKVNSVLANEKRSQSEHALNRLNASDADATQIMKASLSANQSGLEAQLSDAIFRAEWNSFTASLISQK